jgi:Predicted carbamoyl transferase, NodU family
MRNFFRKNLFLLYGISKTENPTMKAKLIFPSIIISHAASAFYPSPYKEALVLTADGVGEWATTTVEVGKENTLEMEKEILFPPSRRPLPPPPPSLLI